MSSRRSLAIPLVAGRIEPVEQAAGNLSDSMQNAQLRMGVVAFAVGLAATMTLLHYHASASWRLVVLLPFLFASYGIHLGLFKTCGVVAMQGKRFTCAGIQPIADPEERARLKRTGAKVLLSSVFWALVATAAVVFAG
jgi:hypothetical protein